MGEGFVDREENISLMPIGWVRNEVQVMGRKRWREVVSEIEISPRLAACLDGIEAFSHVVVIFWMDRVERCECQIKKLRPRNGEGHEVGAFATRSQQRPNPVGLTSVRLLGREGDRLKVQGLDALDGTPVLDLKPYSPHHDLHPEATFPLWVMELERLRANPLPA